MRCGRPPFDPENLRDKCVHREGHFGFSVQCAADADVKELGSFCPNPRIGVTTVGHIRALGYDVVVTSGGGHHATVAVSADWTLEDTRRLVGLFREERNPSPRKAR